MRTRFGERLTCFKCLRGARYYRVKARRCYECEHCGYQVYPTAGTPFEKTRTSLRDWFFVMFLFCASRNGVAAKEVQRQIGVTYKTAWRMCREVRRYMGYVDGDREVGGPPQEPSKIIEVDDTFLGGKSRRGLAPNKAVILGIIERGGDVLLRIVNDRTTLTLRPHLQRWLKPGSLIMSDEAREYRFLGVVHDHQTVNHSDKEYVRGIVHTNNIEAFWAHLKRSMKGTYIAVSKKYLQKYLWEFEFRHNLRHSPHLMLDRLLQAFPKVALSP
jgi:hypothetical protein